MGFLKLKKCNNWTSVSSKLGKERRKKVELEKYSKNNGWKTPKRHKPITSRSWTNPKLYTHKEIHAKIHHTESSENKQQIKRLQERNDALPLRGKQFESQRISHQKSWKSEGTATILFKSWRKQLSIENSVKISFRNERVIRVFSGKLWGFATSQPTLKGWLKEIL